MFLEDLGLGVGARAGRVGSMGVWAGLGLLLVLDACTCTEAV